MQEYDRVKLIKMNKELSEKGLKIGDLGAILGEKRFNDWLVVFEGYAYKNKYGEYKVTKNDVFTSLSEDYLEIATDEEINAEWEFNKKTWNETTE